MWSVKGSFAALRMTVGKDEGVTNTPRRGSSALAVDLRRARAATTGGEGRRSLGCASIGAE